MQPRVDVILRECIEKGIKRGYRRAFKHVENPDEESIFSTIEDCVMGEIYEYFSFSYPDE